MRYHLEWQCLTLLWPVSNSTQFRDGMMLISSTVMGRGGAVAVLLMVFMAITSAMLVNQAPLLKPH